MLKIMGGELTLTDSGFDIHSAESQMIISGEIVKVKTGIHTEFPANMVALLRDRSSLGSRGIHVLAGVIDHSYRGEWLVVLVNYGLPYHIAKGDRIAQVIFVPIFQLEIIKVNSLSDSDRGVGGFGSTGK